MNNLLNTIIISLIFSSSILGQPDETPKYRIPNQASEIIKKIEKFTHLPCLRENYRGKLSNKWDSFKVLEKKIIQNEAIELLKHPNQYVKGLAFFTLIRDMEVEIFPILIKNLNHHEIINIDNHIDNNNDCIIYTEKTSDFFISLSYISNRISKSQKTVLKHKIISENIKIESRDNFLFESEPSDSLYEEIRKIAVDETNEYAIYALSKYQKEQDIYLIKKLLKSKESKYWAFNSVNNYLRPEFFPFIENYLKKEIKKRRRLAFTTYREAYEALIKYDSQESVKVIEFVLNKCNKRVINYHKEYIYKAIKKHPSEKYDAIFQILKNETQNFMF